MLATNSALQINTDTAVVRLDAWFDTIRCQGGYGGPVVHWWQQSLLYTGPGLDWRYEGIIAGYLNLWERTGEKRWLEKASRAGDDLWHGQIENGHFPASSFEINPATAGTPHEAACNAGLLMLALALKRLNMPEWEKYATCARRNIEAFYLNQLWDEESQSFRDSPAAPSFVPNKAATACEALFLLAALSGEAVWVEKYVLPNLNRILKHQIGSKGGILEGAVAQNSFGPRKVEKYFPIYNARCVPALVLGYNWTRREAYLEAALRIMQFVTRWVYEDGSYPTVVYPNLKVNRYPSWIAPLGDVLRAAAELRPFGFTVDMQATLQRVMGGQDPTGGIQTAAGFEAQAGGRLSSLPDLRDLLHVAGWCDKAFRYLSSQVSPAPLLQPEKADNFEIACTFQKKKLRLTETPELLEVKDTQGNTCYRWRKGQSWAEVASPEFFLK